MSLTTELLIVGLVMVSVVLQLGQRRFALWRIILPIAVVAFVAAKYFNGFPTAGNDVVFEVVGAAIGIASGVIAAVLMGVRRDAQGNVILTTGILYAAFWVVVFGARLAFVWAATNSASFDRQIGLFSFQHGITSEAAWTAFFILQAVLMIAVRSIVVGARVFRTHGPTAVLGAAA